MKYLGITPMEAILSAMTLGREIMLHPEELGKVQPGYYADVILVDGNPLEDIMLLGGTSISIWSWLWVEMCVGFPLVMGGSMGGFTRITRGIGHRGSSREYNWSGRPTH